MTHNLATVLHYLFIHINNPATNTLLEMSYRIRVVLSYELTRSKPVIKNETKSRKLLMAFLCEQLFAKKYFQQTLVLDISFITRQRKAFHNFHTDDPETVRYGN